MRRIAHDSMQMDDVQIVEDSRCCLKVNAVITKVGVYQYEDGLAFKSPMELLKATRTARAAKLTVLDHPTGSVPVVMSQSLMKGNIEKPFFDRDKIRAVLNFDKHETDAAFLDTVRAAASKQGKPLDVSIGFYYKADATPNRWRDEKGQEQKYDYVMRDIVIDHVACGVARGRCSFPECGIGVDSLVQGKFKLDYTTMDECVADNQDKENPEAFCAWFMKQTGQCTQDQINTYLSRRGKKVMSEDPKEAFIKGKVAEGLTKEQAEAQYADLTTKPPTTPAKQPEQPPKIPETPPPKTPVPETPNPETPATPEPPAPLSSEQLVEQNRELLKMKAEKDFQKQIDARKRR